MGRVDPWRTDCRPRVCRFVGRCLARIVDAGNAHVSGDDLAPSAKALCSAAIMRGAGQWDDAGNNQFEADGIKRKGKNIGARGGT